MHDLNDNVYDAAEDLIGVRNEVHRIRAKLNKLKSDLSDKKDNLQKATKELDKAVRDLQSPNSLHDLSVEESSALKIDLWMAEGDIVEAWNHIHDAEDDLNYEVRVEGAESRGRFVKKVLIRNSVIYVIMIYRC